MLAAPRSGAGAHYPYPICVCGESGHSSNTPSDLTTRQEKRKGDHARSVERLEGVLDVLGAKREHTVRQDGRAQESFEFRNVLRPHITYKEGEGRSQKGEESGQYVTYQRTATMDRSENKYEIHLTARILF